VSIPRRYLTRALVSDNLRACCLPWQWWPSLRPPLRDRTPIPRYPSLPVWSSPPHQADRTAARSHRAPTCVLSIEQCVQPHFGGVHHSVPLDHPFHRCAARHRSASLSYRGAIPTPPRAQRPGRASLRSRIGRPFRVVTHMVPQFAPWRSLRPHNLAHRDSVGKTAAGVMSHSQIRPIANTDPSHTCMA